MPKLDSSVGRHGPVVAHADGDGPSLVLLHGLAASARWWRKNVPALSATHRVRVIDLPAFGTSRRDSRFHLDQIADQLVSLFDELAIERTSIIGHSMGGLIAARLAADHPDRVRRLVLVDAGFLRFDPVWRHRVTGPIGALRWTRPGLARTLAGDLLRVGPVRLTDATIQLLRADWAEVLPRITAPTLIVWGEQDTICPPVIGERIAERVPGARSVTIARCGHNPMWERPSEFDRAVLEFLAEGGGPPVSAGARAPG